MAPRHLRSPTARPVATTAAAVLLLSVAPTRSETLPEQDVDNDWFRAWPPAGVTFSFPSTLNRGDAPLGDLDTLELQAVYIHSLKFRERFDWLLGVQGYRLQAGVPSDAPVPNTLQSAAAVLGFDARFAESWRVRLEAMPGAYSDFHDLSGDDFNVPLSLDVSYSIGPSLLVGAQLSVNPLRESPVLGAAGVRWRFSENWLLSLWFPRPRIEYQLDQGITLFGGITFSGGSFIVAEDFGSRRGRPDLDGETVDFREIRAGGGLRYAVDDRFGVELGGGWTLDRRYHFHERDLLLNGDGAPYVQLSLGLLF